MKEAEEKKQPNYVRPSGKKRGEKSLGRLSERFIKMFLVSRSNVITLDDAAEELLGETDNGNKTAFKSKVRRLYDIANVMKSLHLIDKIHFQCFQYKKPAFQWIGDAIFPLDVDEVAVLMVGENGEIPRTKRSARLHTLNMVNNEEGEEGKEGENGKEEKEADAESEKDGSQLPPSSIVVGKTNGSKRSKRSSHPTPPPAVSPSLDPLHAMEIETVNKQPRPLSLDPAFVAKLAPSRRETTDSQKTATGEHNEFQFDGSIPSLNAPFSFRMPSLPLDYSEVLSGPPLSAEELSRRRGTELPQAGKCYLYVASSNELPPEELNGDGSPSRPRIIVHPAVTIHRFTPVSPMHDAAFRHHLATMNGFLLQYYGSLNQWKAHSPMEWKEHALLLQSSHS